MSAQCHPDLIEVVEAAAALPMPDLTRVRLLAPPGQSQQRDPRLQVLESELYLRLYLRPRAGRTPAAGDPAVAREFISALSRANRGGGAWESGWTVAGVEPDGRVAVTRDRITFWAHPSQVRADGTAATGGAAAGDSAAGAAAGVPLSKGESCAVRLEKEIRHLFPAFYMALGNRLPEDGPLLRLYWNLTPEGAIRYMRLVTGRLNRAGIPFKTKVLSSPHQYLRADAGVLYVQRADFGRLRPLLRELYAALGPVLHAAVPMFTKRLAPGLGLAEDPGGGLSFGQSRCRAVAEGLRFCEDRGLEEPAARLEQVLAAFRRRGLDPLCPYLEPGSADVYEIDLAP